MESSSAPRTSSSTAPLIVAAGLAGILAGGVVFGWVGFRLGQQTRTDVHSDNVAADVSALRNELRALQEQTPAPASPPSSPSSTATPQKSAQGEARPLATAPAEPAGPASSSPASSSPSSSSPPPQASAARLQPPALRRAFEQAIQQAGVDGQVVDVDCVEAPCIVFFKSPAGGAPAELRETPALSVYADDTELNQAWITTEGGLFALAFSAGANATVNEARVQQRMERRAQRFLP